MSCNSAIYTVNSNTAALIAGSEIPTGTTVRRFGCALENTGMSIRMKASGYYQVDASATIATAEAGIMSLEMYVNGVAYPGAVASKTVAVGDTVTLAIPTSLVRKACGCGDPLSITFILTTGSGALANAAVNVVKV